jgi:hypothetical protein
MRAKQFIPRTSEDLQIDAIRAAKGERYKDREIARILSMRAHGMTWQALMDLPYRILLKMNMIKNAEGGRND